MPNIFLVFVVIFNYIPFGRNVRAIGDNEEVARLSGINVDACKILIFVLCGLAAGMGGTLAAIRMGASTPNLCQGFELDVIASVVLIAASLSGGIGRLTGTIIGAFIMSMLTNGLNILGINAYVQQVVRGIVVIIAVILTIDRKSNKIVK